MHVAIDAVGNRSGGGWSVLTRTVRHLAADPRIERLSVFCSPLDVAASAPPTHDKIEWLERPREHGSSIARVVWSRIGLRSATRKLDADVALSLNGIGVTDCPRVCLIQQAFVVWGTLPRIRPASFAAKIAVLRSETARSVEAADAIAVQTSWMRSRVRETLGCDAVVLPLGLPEPLTRLEAPTPTPRRFAVVGHALPYKRNELIWAAATRLSGTSIYTMKGAHPDVVPELLRDAEALVMASDVESFGLPLVEAFAADCPVVVTDRPWARSVADDAALYFSHADVDHAARVLSDLLTTPGLSDQLRERGRHRLREMWEDDPYRRLADLLQEVV